MSAYSFAQNHPNMVAAFNLATMLVTSIAAPVAALETFTATHNLPEAAGVAAVIYAGGFCLWQLSHGNE
jgi:hypothetical protein